MATRRTPRAARRGPRSIHVTKAKTGGWKVKRAGAKRASVVKRTQDSAEKAAKRMMRKSGGGEVRIHNRKGKIRDSDTVKPGRDPRSSRDTRH